MSPADEPPRATRTPKPPEVHPSGLTILAECLRSPISLDLQWLCHPSVPSFLICTRCYVDYIYGTPFRDAFERARSHPDGPKRCLFGCHRVKSQLWPAAVTTRDLGPLLEFMQRRAEIPDCQGATLVEGQSWYTTADIPGSTICRACYEDGPMTSGFRAKYQLQAIPNACYCDSSVWLVRRWLAKHTETDDWAAVVEDVPARLQFPACPGRDVVKAEGRTWFQAHVSQKAPLQICGTCMVDYFYGAPDQSRFQQVAGGDGNTHCDIGRRSLIFAAQARFEDKDDNIFWRAVEGQRGQAACQTEGMDNAVWYTFPNEPPGFGVCGSCYASVVGVYGGTRFFMRKTHLNPEEQTLCAFSPAHHHLQAHMTKYLESLLLGDWTPFSDFAMKYGKVLPCPGNHYRRGVNRKFWGWGVVAICEHCYVSFAQGTSLESQFVLHGAPDPRGRMCDLYSPRMRQLYAEACNTGDLQGLLAFAQRRHEVWVETIGAIDQIERDVTMAALQANQLQQSGLFYQHLGNTLDATIGHSYTVGNSYAGYGHANEHVLTGATHSRQGAEMAAAATSPSHVARINLLRQRWSQVE